MNTNNLLSFASIFQSHMVLQRDKPIQIWGRAPMQSTVTVSLIHLHEVKINTLTGNNGEWLCSLPPQAPGENYSLCISCDDADAKSIVLEDISIGDIWFACGQSNMEFLLRYDMDWEKVKKYEKNPKIHMYNVPQIVFEGHEKNISGYDVWFTENEIGFETFSAPGYSFARYLQPIINVPIGIVGCNRGGSTASAWLEKSFLSEEPLSIYLNEYEKAIEGYTLEHLKEISLNAWAFEDSAKHSADFIPLLYGQDETWQAQYIIDHKDDPFVPMGPWNCNRPEGLYQHMLKPVIPFTMKGVLWYQGESDAIHSNIYDKLFTALITCWRKQWNEELPFLFVQLAPFEKWLQYDAKGYPEIRYKQELVSKTVPNTAMTSIMDIGCSYDIHPKQKMEVGRRLALLARGKIYGENVLCEPPEFEHAVRKGDQIILFFMNCENPQNNKVDLNVKNNSNEINGFVLIQNDKEVSIDTIHIDGKTIILKASALTNDTCTVNFAWVNYIEVNVFNEAGLPVKPFTVTL